MAEIKTGWLVDFEDNAFAPQTLFSQVRNDADGETLTTRLAELDSAIAALDEAYKDGDDTVLANTLFVKLNESDNVGRTLDSDWLGVDGVLPVKHGGTGANSLTKNQLLIGNDTNAINSITNPTDNDTSIQVLGYKATAPVFMNIGLSTTQSAPETSGETITLTVGDETSSVTLAAASQTTSGVITTDDQEFKGDKTFNGNVDITGKITSAEWNGDTIAASYGGTGRDTLTKGAVLVGNTTNAVTQITPVTDTTALLASNGAGKDPSYKTLDIQDWSPGTTAGPQLNLNVGGKLASTSYAIPSASASASGVVTTDDQTFTGEKTFNDQITANGGIDLNNSTLENVSGYMNSEDEAFYFIDNNENTVALIDADGVKSADVWIYDGDNIKYKVEEELDHIYHTLGEELTAASTTLNHKARLDAIDAAILAMDQAYKDADDDIKDMTLSVDADKTGSGSIRSGEIGIKDGTKLPVKHGGTGTNSLTKNQLIIGKGTSAVGSITNPTDNDTKIQVLGYKATVPAFMNIGLSNAQSAPETSGETITLTVGDETSSVTLDVASETVAGVVTIGKQKFKGDKTFNGNVDITGKITSAEWNGDTIAVSYGGTGRNKLTKGAILIGNNTTAVTQLEADADPITILSSNGTNANPSYKKLDIQDWSPGTTAGPRLNLNVGGKLASTSGPIPSASASASGVVTTDPQTFAGKKTFNSQITANGGINLNNSTLENVSGYMNSEDDKFFFIDSAGETIAFIDADGVKSANVWIYNGDNVKYKVEEELDHIYYTLGEELTAASTTLNHKARLDSIDGKISAMDAAYQEADNDIKDTTLVVDAGKTGSGAIKDGEIGIKSGTKLPVKHGGTGATTLTANQLIIGNGTSAVSSIATGSTTQLLGSNGTKPVYYSMTLTTGQNAAETTGPYIKLNKNNGTTNTQLASVDIPVASASNAGVVITGAQTFAGNKTFNGTIYAKSTLTVDGATSLTDTLSVAKATTLSSTLTVTGVANFNSGIDMKDTAITNASGYSSNITKWYFIDKNNETIAYIDENGITAHDVIVNATKLSSFMTSTNESLDGKAPTNHASTATTYGKGSGTKYGHVKLSDAINSSLDKDDGVAATPKAVKEAYDAAVAASNNNSNINDKNLQVDLSLTDSVKLSAVNNNIGIKNTLGIGHGGTGADTAAEARHNIIFIGMNPIKSTTDDIHTNWGSLESGIAYYNTANQLNGQPSTYGFLLNQTAGGSISGQTWTTSGADMYVRASTSNDGFTSWYKLLSTKKAVTIGQGGTGATNAADARANLGVLAASDTYQYSTLRPANHVLAGPSSGDPDKAEFRALVAADIPTLTTSHLPVISVAKGGTGKTTTAAAQRNLLQDIALSEVTVKDDSQIVFKYSEPDDEKGTLLYKPASLLWNYIDGKVTTKITNMLSSTYGLTGSSGNSTFTGTVTFEKATTFNKSLTLSECSGTIGKGTTTIWKTNGSVGGLKAACSGSSLTLSGNVLLQSTSSLFLEGGANVTVHSTEELYLDSGEYLYMFSGKGLVLDGSMYGSLDDMNALTPVEGQVFFVLD